MRSGAYPAGSGPDDPRGSVAFHSCQALTPETGRSTHYFFQESHRSDQGDAQTTQSLFDGLLAAFEEDRAMILAQARNLALGPGRAMLPLHMDAALARFRRIVDDALQAEQRSRS